MYIDLLEPLVLVVDIFEGGWLGLHIRFYAIPVKKPSFSILSEQVKGDLQGGGAATDFRKACWNWEGPILDRRRDHSEKKTGCLKNVVLHSCGKLQDQSNLHICLKHLSSFWKKKHVVWKGHRSWEIPNNQKKTLGLWHLISVRIPKDTPVDWMALTTEKRKKILCLIPKDHTGFGFVFSSKETAAKSTETTASRSPFFASRPYTEAPSRPWCVPGRQLRWDIRDLNGCFWFP